MTKTPRAIEQEGKYIADSYAASRDELCANCGRRRCEHAMDEKWELEPCAESQCADFTHQENIHRKAASDPGPIVKGRTG